MTRGTKNYYKHGGRDISGVDPVDYTNLPPPPRFATRACDELGPKLVDLTFDKITDILRAHGWFEG